MTDATKFQVGKSYETRSPCDQGTVIRFTVESRTAKTIKIRSIDSQCNGKTFRPSTHNGVEFIKPWGSYSMSPIATAEKVVTG